MQGHYFSESMPSARHVKPTLFESSDESGFLGLPSFGNYEEKKKRLAEERKQDYLDYINKKNEEERLRKERKWQELDQMDYLEILRKKKEEERRYRDINGIEGMIFTNDSLSKTSSTQSQFGDSEYLTDTTPDITLSYSSRSSTVPERLPVPISSNLLRRNRGILYTGLSGNDVDHFSARHNLQRPEFADRLLSLNPVMEEPRIPVQRVMSYSSYTPSFGVPTANRRRYQSAQTDDDYGSVPTSSCWEWWNNDAPRNNNFLEPDRYSRNSTAKINGPLSPYMDPRIPQDYNLLSPYKSTGAGSYLGEGGLKALSGKKPEPRNILSAQEYRTELEKQIEEHKMRKVKEKENEREEEEKLRLRVEQQRLRILSEYEEDQRKRKLKEEELQRKRELILQAQAELQRELEEQRKQQRMRMRTPITITPANNSLHPPEERIASPPLPTLQKQLKKNELTTTDAMENKASPWNENGNETGNSDALSPSRMARLEELRKQLHKEQTDSTQRMQQQQRPYKVLDRDEVM